jgi:kumamolisin
MPFDHYVAIPGTERQPMAGATKSEASDPNESMSVTVVLRRRPPKKNTPPLAELVHRGERLTRRQFATRFGAAPEDIKKVEAFAQANGLTVESVNPAARTLRLSGTVAVFSRAFRVDLYRYTYPGGTYRGRAGAVYVPAELEEVVRDVLGLDDRPQARPHCRILRTVTPAATSPSSYTAPQIAQFYDFPTPVNGAGETIGIIELGGGYSQSDLDSYFSSLGITPPSVAAVAVDGAQNQPTGDPNGPDAEVMLDIEVAGAVAPGANIVVYFAPNTDSGFLDAINQAAMDNQNKPSVLSISWGGPESTWTSQSLQSYNNALQSAAAVGVTVCVACGDNGSTDGVTDGEAHVDFPASSPYSLACGGTHLDASGQSIIDEEVWNDLPSDGATGGGVSAIFPIPSWQDAAGVPASVNPGNFKGRGVPDVAGDADPATGYQVEVDGSSEVVGGTSAVAPLWAGLIALFNQSVKTPVGYLNPNLYQKVALAAGTFHDITSGDNGSYQAGPGWDACTGWGSPNGAVILQSLSTGTPAKISSQVSSAE